MNQEELAFLKIGNIGWHRPSCAAGLQKNALEQKVCPLVIFNFLLKSMILLHQVVAKACNTFLELEVTLVLPNKKEGGKDVFVFFESQNNAFRIHITKNMDEIFFQKIYYTE